MTTITFDTHALIRELREADFTEKQAEAVVRVLSKSQERLVTTEHFDNEMKLLRSDMRNIEMRLDGRLNLIQWMLAAVVIAEVMPLLKQLFS